MHQKQFFEFFSKNNLFWNNLINNIDSLDGVENPNNYIINNNDLPPMTPSTKPPQNRSIQSQSGNQSQPLLLLPILPIILTHFPIILHPPHVHRHSSNTADYVLKMRFISVLKSYYHYLKICTIVLWLSKSFIVPLSSSLAAERYVSDKAWDCAPSNTNIIDYNTSSTNSSN